MTENEVGKIIVDSAIAVHRELGPGLLETVYEVILAYELGSAGLALNIKCRYRSIIKEWCSMWHSEPT